MSCRLMFGALAALCFCSAAAAATPVDWRAAARTDIAAAYDIYAANHPGMHDPLNPGFPAQLERARAAGLAYAGKTLDEAGYKEALGAFSAVLSDGHAQLAPKQPGGESAPLQFEWPGFVAAWRGDKLKVHYAAPDASVAVGSTIEGCDGMDARTLVERKLLTRNFRPAEPGQWWSKATHVFAPSTDLASRRPVRCTFRSPAGATQTLTLAWSPAPANIGQLANAATDGERTPIGLTEPRPGMFLIGMPDFDPDEQGMAAYRELFTALRSRSAELGKARAVVIDLRYNNGGSSSWSFDAAKALWGDATVEAAMENLNKDVQIWWRASPGNTAYVADLEPMLRKAGNTEVADMIRPIAAGMKQALAGRKIFFNEDEGKHVDAKAVPPTKFETPVYVITPGRCASACLDALDTFKRFGNVKLIGAPTSADSTYMEVRVADLPSGKGRIVIPNKVWMGRARKSGAAYTPEIMVTDLDWSTRTFLDRIEQDLRGARR